MKVKNAMEATKAMEASGIMCVCVCVHQRCAGGRERHRHHHHHHHHHHYNLPRQCTYVRISASDSPSGLRKCTSYCVPPCTVAKANRDHRFHLRSMTTTAGCPSPPPSPPSPGRGGGMMVSSIHVPPKATSPARTVPDVVPLDINTHERLSPAMLLTVGTVAVENSADSSVG